jgi:hypothetical protein
MAVIELRLSRAIRCHDVPSADPRNKVPRCPPTSSPPSASTAPVQSVPS